MNNLPVSWKFETSGNDLLTVIYLRGPGLLKEVFFLQYLSRVVSEMKAEEMANISKGLEYAFDQFDQVKLLPKHFRTWQSL